MSPLHISCRPQRSLWPLLYFNVPIWSWPSEDCVCSPSLICVPTMRSCRRLAMSEDFKEAYLIHLCLSLTAAGLSEFSAVALICWRRRIRGKEKDMALRIIPTCYPQLIAGGRRPSIELGLLRKHFGLCSQTTDDMLAFFGWISTSLSNGILVLAQSQELIDSAHWVFQPL